MPIHTEVTGYGYRSRFEEPVTLDDLRAWLDEVRLTVAGRETFGQLLDLRNPRRFFGDPANEGAVQAAMLFQLSHGLARSAVVVASGQLALKIKQLAFGTAIYQRERYINGSAPGWESTALDWVEQGIEPDDATHPALLPWQ